MCLYVVRMQATLLQLIQAGSCRTERELLYLAPLSMLT